MIKKTGHDGNRDKRIIERQLLKGIVSEKDLKEYLSQLPDISDNAEEVVIDVKKRNQT